MISILVVVFATLICYSSCYVAARADRQSEEYYNRLKNSEEYFRLKEAENYHGKHFKDE